jgi:hypothetical protein
VSLGHLAEGVRRARTVQKAADIRAKGGPSGGTLRRLHDYTPDKPPWRVRPGTFAELDAGIDGWSPGTALALFELPDEPAGIVVTDLGGFADLVAQRVVTALAAAAAQLVASG